MANNMSAVELNKMRTTALPDERSSEERKKARRRIAKGKRKRNPNNVNIAKVASRDRSLAVLTVIVLGLIMLGVIFVSAYCASIKNDINNTNKQTIAMQEEIDYLKVEIESGSNIATVEKKALKELGMIYPTADQYVYIEGIKASKQNLAQVIKENAYEF